jgi:hypothetical protein
MTSCTFRSKSNSTSLPRRRHNSSGELIITKTIGLFFAKGDCVYFNFDALLANYFFSGF